MGNRNLVKRIYLVTNLTLVYMVVSYLFFKAYKLPYIVDLIVLAFSSVFYIVDGFYCNSDKYKESLYKIDEEDEDYLKY